MSRYWAFVSYSHRDEAWATWLHRGLERYRLPKRIVREGRAPARLYPIFRDREELPTAVDLGSVIQNALEESRTLIVICSPNSAASKWVNAEIETFKRLGRAERILALIVDGEPPACFPPAIEGEPIAADVRPGKDGRANALLKLVAGTAGVGFDELRQRDAQRRQRRMIALTSASLALAVLMAALGGYAIYERNEARREHERAQRRFNEVRSLARIFIHDVHDAIQHLEGSTEARRLLVTTALDYLDRLSAEGGDDRELWLEIGQAYAKVGDVQGAPDAPNLGDTEGALASYRKAQSIFERIDAADDLAAAHARIGVVMRARRDYDAALAEFQTVLRLERGDPALTERRIAETLAEQGDWAAAGGDLDRAQALYAEALGHARRAIDLAPPETDVERRREVVMSAAALGDILAKTGDLDGSIAAFEDAWRRCRDLYGEVPENRHVRRDLLALMGRRADAMRRRGDLKQALAEWEMLLTQFQRDARTDAADASAKRAVAVVLGRIGSLRAALGEAPAAVESFHEMVRVLYPMAGADPADSRLRNDLIWALIQQLPLLEPAGPSYRNVQVDLLAVYRMGADPPGAPADDLANAARALLYATPEDLRDPRAALDYAKRAVELTRGENPEHLDALAQAHFDLGEVDRAIERMRQAIALVGDDPAYRAELEAALAEFLR